MTDLIPYGSRRVVRARRDMDSRLALELASDRGRAIRAAQKIHDIERVGDYGLRAAGHLGRTAEEEAASCQTPQMQRAILTVGVRAVYQVGEAVEDLPGRLGMSVVIAVAGGLVALIAVCVLVQVRATRAEVRRLRRVVTAYRRIDAIERETTRALRRIARGR